MGEQPQTGEGARASHGPPGRRGSVSTGLEVKPGAVRSMGEDEQKVFMFINDTQ